MGREEYIKEIKEKIKNELTSIFEYYDACHSYLPFSKLKTTITSLKGKGIRYDENELIQIFQKIATDHRNKYPDKFPTQKPTSDQKKQFATELSEIITTKITYVERENIVTLTIGISSEEIQQVFKSIKLSNDKIEFSLKEDKLIVNIKTSDYIISTDKNENRKIINNFVEVFCVLGHILEIFKYRYNDEGVVIDVKNTKFQKEEPFCDRERLLYSEVGDLVNIINFDKTMFADENVVVFSESLRKIYISEKQNEIQYSLHWYSISLVSGEIKTQFICRYIAFEALICLWVNLNPKERQTQDKIKFSAAGILAVNRKQYADYLSKITSIVNTRNDLFHGSQTEENINRQFFEVSLIYSELLMRTLEVNK